MRKDQHYLRPDPWRSLALRDGKTTCHLVSRDGGWYTSNRAVGARELTSRVEKTSGHFSIVKDDLVFTRVQADLTRPEISDMGHQIFTRLAGGSRAIPMQNRFVSSRASCGSSAQEVGYSGGNASSSDDCRAPYQKRPSVNRIHYVPSLIMRNVPAYGNR